MSDDPYFRGPADRSRTSSSEDHQVRSIVEAIKKKFPQATAEAIEGALERATRPRGNSGSRTVTAQHEEAIPGRQ